MNENDSEKIAGILISLGYEKTDEQTADIVIFNTCSIRENADDRFFGHLGNFKAEKKKRPDMVLAVCGCMMQQARTVQTIKEKFPYVDIIFGTHNLHRFGELLSRHAQVNRPLIDIWEDSPIEENVPFAREFKHKAFVSIMNGCDNFCTYCVVPYTRGREKSREPEYVLKEIASLAKDGCKEVMLLGQNVNSYGKTLDAQYTFAKLLREVSKIDGIERIRFMTSHPKDFSFDIIEAIRDCGNVCPSVHLPVQSGSSRILELMRRNYTKESYLALIDTLRAQIPKVAISTDIIVGFPSETREDFSHTLDVVRKVRFDSAFTFVFSPRTGTPAAAMGDFVDKEEIKKRFEQLTKIQHKIMYERSLSYVGSIESVIVDGSSKNDDSVLTGRTMDGKLVNFEGEANIGDTVNVKIDKAMTFYLAGKIV